MKRYPVLTAAMISCSLGYFSPHKAGVALLHYIHKKPFCCEWYADICDKRGKGFYDNTELLKINEDIVRRSFQNRRNWKGYMADMGQALALVRHYNKTGQEPNQGLASWF